MARYKITLIGLYTYSPALFEQLEVPDNDPTKTYNIDRDTLIANILERGGDFPVLYPNWDFMRYMIGVWSKNCAYMFKTLLDTMNADFNPIENYDRHSEITRQGSGTSSNTSAGESSNSSTGQDVNSQTAFNSDTFKDARRSTTTGSGTSTDNATSQSSGSTIETVQEYIHGNIGVRSGQELVEQSRNMAMFKIYDVIANDFINRFCIKIY